MMSLRIKVGRTLSLIILLNKAMVIDTPGSDNIYEILFVIPPEHSMEVKQYNSPWVLPRVLSVCMIVPGLIDQYMVR